MRSSRDRLLNSSLVSGATIYGVANVNNSLNLVQFESGTPADLDSSLAISGLNAGEAVLGIDFRPSNGQLYGLTSQNRLVTINTTSAVATPVGAGLGLVLNGTAFGFDFNRRSTPFAWSAKRIATT